jgi:hypothetical protein
VASRSLAPPRRSVTVASNPWLAFAFAIETVAFRGKNALNCLIRCRLEEPTAKILFLGE